MDKMSKVDLQDKYPQWMCARNQEGILSDKKVCYHKGGGGNLFGVRLRNKAVGGCVLAVPLFLLRENNVS